MGGEGEGAGGRSWTDHHALLQLWNADFILNVHSSKHHLCRRFGPWTWCSLRVLLLNMALCSSLCGVFIFTHISSHIIFAYIIIYIYISVNLENTEDWEGESFPQFISRLQVDIFLSLDLFGQLLGDVTSRWCSRRPCHVYEAPLPPDTKVFTRFTGWSGSPVRVPLSLCFFLVSNPKLRPGMSKARRCNLKSWRL